MPWYLYLALKQIFPTGRRFSFFTAISIVSVAVGVGLLVVVVSVMDGFAYKYTEMMVDTEGDAEVRADGFISNRAGLMDTIDKIPGVVATTPFAEGIVMAEHESNKSFPTVQGIDVERADRVTPIDRYIVKGALSDLDDDSIILGSQLALSIGAHVGSTIEVYSPLQIEKAKNDEVMLPSELDVVGIFEIGHQEVDSSTIIVTLRRMQELYGLGTAVHGIKVKIAPGLDVDEVTARINRVLQADQSVLWPPLRGLLARSWREINPEFLGVLQLEKNILIVILLFVALVAAFLIMSLLLVLVLKKTSEIGLLSAMGGTRWKVGACFCLQGAVIGLVGTVLGLGLGFTFLHFRNTVVQLGTRFFGSEALLVRFYKFSEVPSHIGRRDLIIVVVSGIVLSTLAGIIPALVAARLQPVEALRRE